MDTPSDKVEYVTEGREELVLTIVFGCYSSYELSHCKYLQNQDTDEKLLESLILSINIESISIIRQSGYQYFVWYMTKNSSETI